METMSQRMLLIAGAGLFAATLALVSVRHSHTSPRAVEVFVPDLNARVANFVPADDDVQVRDEVRIARARLVGLEGELEETRVRSAARQR